MAENAVPVKKQETVLDKIQLAKDNVISRLPGGIDKNRFFLGVMTAIQKSKANAQPGKSLADCDPQSVLLAAYEAAEVGCNLAPSLALGWLIPYGKEAQFQPSYRFFIQKAYETGEVKHFFAEVVYESDQFNRQFAPKRNLFHAPGDGPRVMEKAIGAYALVEFTDGEIEFEYLTREQIKRHRDHSKQPNSMKWTTFWEEGWRITPIRVIAKRLPLKSRNLEELVELVNRDTERELIISADRIAEEPSLPRRISERLVVEDAPVAEATTAATATAEAQPAKAEAAQTNGQPAQTATSSMFPPEEDPIVSGAEAQKFWDKAFALTWKKKEVSDFLKREFKVESPLELRKSQLAKATELISQASRE